MAFTNSALLEKEVKRRRTFAIISHPDAGKTTLTEKLLLLGGAIRLAGSVKAKRTKKFTTSDWMELEKQRGISVSTSVMNFEYRGYACNLLDTPGHQDFSEDTYRTLAAADAAIMLIDAAKGVEPQTIKLFEVCKARKIPIFTFINKMDREARDVFELLAEIENVLGIMTYPFSWPLDSGERFKGIIERSNKNLHYFEGKREISLETKPKIFSLDEARQNGSVDPSLIESAMMDLDMLDTAGETFSQEKFMAGELSPVFFGSAMNNFGVRYFLETFLEMCHEPLSKQSSHGPVNPLSPLFSGFIFKIQANMDPKHRDRIAFLRVVSGAFEAGLQVFHPRLNREIRLTQPQQFFAQERSSAETAFAGDIVGIYDPGLFAIGDTLVEGDKFVFKAMPSFAPEFFSVVRTQSALKRKQLMKGLFQLCQEGTVQMFVDESRAASDPILAAVGTLQFDVLLFRLQNEYQVDCKLEMINIKHARWTDAPIEQIKEAKDKLDVMTVKDLNGHTLFLFANDFSLSYFSDQFPKINLYNSDSHLKSFVTQTLKEEDLES